MHVFPRGPLTRGPAVHLVAQLVQAHARAPHLLRRHARDGKHRIELVLVVIL